MASAFVQTISLSVALFWSTAVASAAEKIGTVEYVPISDTMTTAEDGAIRQAGEIANRVKNSDCFHDFISRRSLVDTNGQTPMQVADALAKLSGRVSVGVYYRCLKGSAGCDSPTLAVAYRQPPSEIIYLNRAHYGVDTPDFDIYELAGTLAHEGLGHSLGGYDHSFDWTPSRDWSVPYSISGASTKSDDAFQHCRAEYQRALP